MRIGFITQWFPPEPALVPAGIAAGLASRGHDVDVITAFPNYPTGRLHDGWRQRAYQRDSQGERVTVHRSPIYPSHDNRAVHRAANYLSFAGSAAVNVTTRLPRPDVWLVYSSPATAALPALIARPVLRAPICLHIQDLWPDSVTGSNLVRGRVAQIIDRGLTSFTNASYKRASRIGVISPGMIDILIRRGVPPEKISWVPNWGLDDRVDSHPELRRSLGLPRGPLFLYAGNLGQFQGLASLVDAFAQVPEAHLVLMGDGVERESLAQAAVVAPSGNIHVRGRVAADEVAAFVAASDVLVVSLQDTPLLRATMPSKVQSSLAAGKPIFVHGAGDVANVVVQAGAGLAVAPGNHQGVVAGLRELSSRSATWPHMGEAARRCYEEVFCPQVGISRLEAMLEQATEEGHS